MSVELTDLQNNEFSKVLFSLKTLFVCPITAFVCLRKYDYLKDVSNVAIANAESGVNYDDKGQWKPVQRLQQLRANLVSHKVGVGGNASMGEGDD